MIPEIDIWRAASLMLKRYGKKALDESTARADELFAEQDHDGAAVWRRIIDAVGQLANTTPTVRPSPRPRVSFLITLRFLRGRATLAVDDGRRRDLVETGLS